MLLSVCVWEKSVAILCGIGLYMIMKVMDYYTKKDREAEAQ